LFIVAGAVGCANDDPWVGEWKIVVDVEAEVAEFVEAVEVLNSSAELVGEEPTDIDKAAEEYAAKLRAIDEDGGLFLTFERGRDGKLVVVYELRGLDNSEVPSTMNATPFRILSEQVTETSELIRCRFLHTEFGATTFELKLASEDLLEGSWIWNTPTKRPVKLERVR